MWAMLEESHGGRLTSEGWAEFTEKEIQDLNSGKCQNSQNPLPLDHTPA